MKKFVAAVAMFVASCATPSYAQSVVAHVRSWHSHGDYVNGNVGVGYRTADGAVVGVLRNSYGDPTVYAGYDWRPSRFYGVVFAGAVGYADTPVMPYVMAYGRLPVTNAVSLQVGAGPFVGDGKPGLLLHSFIEVTFK